MKKICVVTGTRAEYGLLLPTIRKIMCSASYELSLVVTGSHLLSSQGHTVDQIEKDSIPIARKIVILDDGKDISSSTVNQAIARMIAGFDRYLEDEKPDLVIVLGDRYEILAAATAAMIKRVPIAHIHGGEVTEGAIDDSIRHAITKMATIHFTSCEAYRRRVIQLGEDPSRVHTVGACGIENIVNNARVDRDSFFESVGLSKRLPFLLVTLHPETISSLPPRLQCRRLLDALREFPEYGLLFTSANADAGGYEINEELERFISENDNTTLVSNLGTKRYLAALEFCDAVVGNSSSGILEAPSFGKPTVNVGNRQKGRVRSSSVIDCELDTQSIVNGVKKALSPSFRQSCKKVVNPYGDGRVSDRILSHIDDFFNTKLLNEPKRFFDLPDMCIKLD